MTAVERRIRTSLLVEKMQKQKKYSERVGLEDVSVFRGQYVSEIRKIR